MFHIVHIFYVLYLRNHCNFFTYCLMMHYDAFVFTKQLNDEAMVVKRCCEVSVTAPHHVPWALDGEIYHATQFTIR